MFIREWGLGSRGLSDIILGVFRVLCAHTDTYQERWMKSSGQDLPGTGPTASPPAPRPKAVRTTSECRPSCLARAFISQSIPQCNSSPTWWGDTIPLSHLSLTLDFSQLSFAVVLRQLHKSPFVKVTHWPTPPSCRMSFSEVNLGITEAVFCSSDDSSFLSFNCQT